MHHTHRILNPLNIASHPVYSPIYVGQSHYYPVFINTMWIEFTCQVIACTAPQHPCHPRTYPTPIHSQHIPASPVATTTPQSPPTDVFEKLRSILPRNAKLDAQPTWAWTPPHLINGAKIPNKASHTISRQPHTLPQTFAVIESLTIHKLKRTPTNATR